MRKDADILREVREQLRADKDLRDLDIRVAVNDRVVTLSGHVSSNVEKFSAIRTAEWVSGVAARAEDLEVRLAPSPVRPDAEIARAAEHTLRWYVKVPHDSITVGVVSGWITLEGEVDHEYLRTEAERAVQYLRGVGGVTNLITVKSQADCAHDVSRNIKYLFRHSAELDADHVTVEAQDGRVTLRGTVRSATERQDAERAAWAAPGVEAVEDRLVVQESSG